MGERQTVCSRRKVGESDERPKPTTPAFRLPSRDTRNGHYECKEERSTDTLWRKVKPAAHCRKFAAQKGVMVPETQPPTKERQNAIPTFEKGNCEKHRRFQTALERRGRHVRVGTAEEHCNFGSEKRLLLTRNCTVRELTRGPERVRGEGEQSLLVGCSKSRQGPSLYKATQLLVIGGFLNTTGERSPSIKKGERTWGGEN